jgi:hypothetical protein
VPSCEEVIGWISDEVAAAVGAVLLVVLVLLLAEGASAGSAMRLLLR